MSTNSQPTRQKILQATLDLLCAKPSRKSRMSDVAKQAEVSRQAVYLHFGSRAELLISATLFLDEQLNADTRLRLSRAAATGSERLAAFVTAWGNYIPEIYGIAKALIELGDSDQAAALAWRKRMQDMREGCEAAIVALDKDATLNPEFSVQQATDVMWTLLSVQSWEHYIFVCGWTQEQYIATTLAITRKLFCTSPDDLAAHKKATSNRTDQRF